MISRRLVYSASIGATAMSFFTLGVVHARRATQDASYDAKLDATIRAEVRSELGKTDRTAALVPAATSGHANPRSESPDVTPSAASRARMVAEIKKELQQEMGLVPVTLLRDRRSSFVELHSYDNLGKPNYGTAGYLGNGYFITVKHAVVALKDNADRQSTRKIASEKRLQGKGDSGEGRRYGRRRRRSTQRRLGDYQDARGPGSAGAACRFSVRVRLRGPHLPARERLLEGHYPLDRLRRPAHVEWPGHVSDRRPPRRVGWRSARSARESGRHLDRPDTGRLPLLLHPPDPRRNAAQAAQLRAARTDRRGRRRDGPAAIIEGAFAGGDCGSRPACRVEDADSRGRRSIGARGEHDEGTSQ